ncbi:MmcQ/YjbR family DNA-binding protein [Sulfidibacter corallicola]|uniref:MmcQ/YjbR family DNA-binding protein n=1 Tax=Sulfidibacter corallicola TaxID=2818388 RepID=A0A8A4TU64_SULCO|nr:MmcQ/YjbR family DNA-binding protein [Sulfidibacter corallicola]QTD52572.1 MmcQ/YjbR family DNA-binding protein [Sulfidibacter corallicola]
MTLEEIREFCAGLPGSTEDIKWECNLVFSAVDKMYAVVDVKKGSTLDHVIPADPDSPPAISFKTLPEMFPSLCEREGIAPAPYLARNSWVLAKPNDALPAPQLRDFIRLSHKFAFQKLTKKKQREILGE